MMIRGVKSVGFDKSRTGPSSDPSANNRPPALPGARLGDFGTARWCYIERKPGPFRTPNDDSTL